MICTVQRGNLISPTSRHNIIYVTSVAPTHWVWHTVVSVTRAFRWETCRSTMKFSKRKIPFMNAIDHWKHLSQYIWWFHSILATGSIKLGTIVNCMYFTRLCLYIIITCKKLLVKFVLAPQVTLLLVNETPYKNMTFNEYCYDWLNGWLSFICLTNYWIKSRVHSTWLLGCHPLFSRSDHQLLQSPTSVSYCFWPVFHHFIVTCITVSWFWWKSLGLEVPWRMI